MGADTAPPIYSIARARKEGTTVAVVAAVAAAWRQRGGSGGGSVAAAVAAAWRRRGDASGGVAITTPDTFISCKERNAQYSMAFPIVKTRQIAQNRLVLPN